jgi:hypothetical protein
LVLVLIASVAFWLTGTKTTSAQKFTNRTIVVNTAQTSVTATHDFQLTYASAVSTGSLVFEYCLSPVYDYPCTAPAGLDVSTATLSAQSGNTGFSVDGADTTANKIVLTRLAAVPALVASNYTFDNITNPSTANQTIYIRLSTYSSADGSGAFIDNGAVAFATSPGFNVGAYVPPYLRFCVGITVSSNCSSTSGNGIDLGKLVPSKASAAQSQFSTGTNDTSGYSVSVLGHTMISGNNIISSLTLPTASLPGNSQFGINLRDNSNPDIGEEPTGIGTGVPTANYNTPNLFMFQDGDVIASSPLPSDFNRMTASYLVNVRSDQPPGVYASTLTYVATVQF